MRILCLFTAIEAVIEQSTLDGMAVNESAFLPQHAPGVSAALGYNLFFAAFPEPDEALLLFGEGRNLIEELGLRKRPQAVDRLHTTLCVINDFPVGNHVVRAAIAAANSVTCAALPMVFDRAASGGADSAFMLRGGSATDEMVARLRRPLVAALRRHGLDPDESRSPHMSLVYRCGQVVPEREIAPLAWTARRFALVLSHVGNTHHQWMGEWRLPRRS